MSVRPVLRLAAAACAALLAAASHAQTHLAPGLWEQQVTMKSDNAELDAQMARMKEQMASLPPEQKAMVEKMMASRGMGLGGGAHAIRMCLTKEQAERDTPPQHDGRCSQQDFTRSGSTMTYKFTCQGQGGQPMTGEGTFTLDGPKAYTGRSTMNATMQGKPMQVQTDIVGKWVGSDCGDVKPMEAPKH